MLLTKVQQSLVGHEVVQRWRKSRARRATQRDSYNERVWPQDARRAPRRGERRPVHAAYAWEGAGSWLGWG
jgi:hypothetical protein